MIEHKQRLVDLIEAAFVGVKLDGGVSIRQSEAIDDYCEGITESEFKRLPEHEVTDDWKSVADSELDRICVAHLDANGLRYYLPRLMFAILDRYESWAGWAIGTLYSLRPDVAGAEARYASLTTEQNKVVAEFLSSLPHLVAMDQEGGVIVKRALRDYWAVFLR